MNWFRGRKAKLYNNLREYQGDQLDSHDPLCLRCKRPIPKFDQRAAAKRGGTCITCVDEVYRGIVRNGGIDDQGKDFSGEETP